jgi:hypothetical protein
MAKTLRLNLGMVLLASFIFDVIPAIAALWASHWLSVRITPSGELPPNEAQAPNEATLPGTFAAFMPVVLPFGLLTLTSIVVGGYVIERVMMQRWMRGDLPQRPGGGAVGEQPGFRGMRVACAHGQIGFWRDAAETNANTPGGP